MATASDLVALGINPMLALRMAETPTAFTCGGASIGVAAQIGGTQQVIFVNASNSGSGLKLPNIGGQNGALLGDDITIFNLLSATVQVYSSAPVGGTPIIYMTGVSNSGTTGVAVDPGFQALFIMVTPSTWMGVKASA